MVSPEKRRVQMLTSTLPFKSLEFLFLEFLKSVLKTLVNQINFLLLQMPPNLLLFSNH